MKKKRLLAVLLTVAMVSSLFAGCGKKAANTDATSKGTKLSDAAMYPGTTEDKSITVNLGSEPGDLFTCTATDTLAGSVLRHVMENLVMLDENDNPIPGCAKDWKVSDDQLVYTFNIREGMKWSNGEPVTANDFVYAWTKLLTPETASDYAYFGYVFKNGREFNEGSCDISEVGFKAVSDTQLEVTLAQPTPYFVSMLAFQSFAPLNQKGYEQFGETYATDADKIVTNGAFNFTSWEHENKIVMAKNNDYWNADAVEVETINFVMINDSNATLNSFKAGEVDIAGLTGDQAKAMAGEAYPVQTYDDGSTFYLEYNMADGPLTNKNLRQAISYAVDNQAFVDSIAKNNSKVPTGFTPPCINGAEGKFRDEIGATYAGYNVTKAKELYTKALEELGVDKLDLVMICDDGDTAQLNAAFIQEQLKTNLGLELKVEAMPFKSRLERMSNKDFSIVFAGWGPDYNDPMTFLDMFETGNGNNHTSFSNATYDDLLNKARLELDAKKRMEYLGELDKLLMDELPIGPIYWRSRDYVVSGKIASGVVRTAFQDMNYRYVKLSK